AWLEPSLWVCTHRVRTSQDRYHASPERWRRWGRPCARPAPAHARSSRSKPISTWRSRPRWTWAWCCRCSTGPPGWGWTSSSPTPTWRPGTSCVGPGRSSTCSTRSPSLPHRAGSDGRDPARRGGPRSPRLILHNATIHSPIERFATALHVEEGIITWMGDEDTAAYRARAHPQARLIDAEQALITPAFHDASSAAQPANALHRAGITAAHIHLGSAPDTSGYGPHLDLVGIHTDLPSAGPALHRLAPGA